MAYGGTQELPEIRPDGTPRIRQDGDGANVDNAFDRWLGRSLHGAFDTVIAEPLPTELLRLIEEVTSTS